MAALIMAHNVLMIVICWYPSIILWFHTRQRPCPPPTMGGNDTEHVTENGSHGGPVNACSTHFIAIILLNGSMTAELPVARIYNYFKDVVPVVL